MNDRENDQDTDSTTTGFDEAATASVANPRRTRL